MDSPAARARTLLEANSRRAEHDGRALRFTLPAPVSYPFQWFWDSCFHAIVWTHFDRERAADELRSLLAWQRPNGFVPHVVFWDQCRLSVRAAWHHLESRGIPWLRDPVTSEHLQPPVLARAVERIGGAFAREALPQVAAFYRYVARERDPDGDGLASLIAQFESGLDFSPVYNEGHDSIAGIYGISRAHELVNKLLGFDAARIARLTDHHQEDVLFNAIYGDGLRALARLAGDDDELARWANEHAERVTAALLERAWDPQSGLFRNLVGRSERRTRTETIHGLMPLLLEDLPKDVAARLVERLTDQRAFWTPWPVASVARSEPTFNRTSHIHGVRFIWRGPASMNTNWFLVHGLRRHGYDDVADELAARSLELVERSGFNEFYDPLDGSPVGAADFGWATLAIDF